MQRSGEEAEVEEVEEVESEKRKKKSETTTREKRPGIETGIFLAMAFLA